MTTQILAYTERPEFKALLEFELKAITGFAPVVHDSLEELESMLAIFPVVEVLVVDTPRAQPNFASFLEKVKKGAATYRNVILIGEGNHLGPNLTVFHQGDVATMLSHLKKNFGRPETDTTWVSMPISALYHFRKLPFDLFVKLSDEKFVKRIPSLEEIEDHTVKSFKDRGISELYFHREHNKDFSRMLINNMIEKLEQNFENDEVELKARTEVFGTVKEIVHSLGIPAKVIEICDTMVADLATNVIKDGGKLARHLERLRSTDLALHYRFVELTCYLGSQLLIALDEKNYHTELKRFIFAAYFCDMTLTDDQHYHHFNLDNAKTLKTQEKKEVMDHAWKAANLVSKYKDAPMDIAIVIKQHHGAIDGAGFPVKKSPHITNLTKCLIISQELAYGMLTQTHKPAIDVLKKMVEKNQGSGLQEIVELFEISLRK